MCRLLYATSNKLESSFMVDLFKELDKSAGGDGLGIGGLVNEKPFIHKSITVKIEELVEEIKRTSWDNGFFFHTRRASVGKISDENCHPFTHKNAITVHNGHIDGAGVLKLMMLENIERYSPDGWTEESIYDSTDSNILSYFIAKRGFNIVPAMQCGTVMTMYPKKVHIYNGWSLEAIAWGNIAIFASEIPPSLGLKSDCWKVFSKGSELTINPDGSYYLGSGYDVDGKELYKNMNKRKGGKSKNKQSDICEVE